MNKILILFFSTFTVYFFTQFPLPELLYILKALFLFGILGFIGIIFFYLISRDKSKNWPIMVGGGMIAGPVLFLFFLNLISYLFKGPIFHYFLFISVSAVLIKLVWKKKSHLLSIIFKPKHKKDIQTKRIVIIFAIHTVLFFFLANRADVGGDVWQYWAFSTSFIRGNFPVLMPWQPNFLTVYHVGTPMILGFLQVVFGIVVERIHFFFSFYILTAVFLFVTGLGLKKSYSLTSFLPAVFGIFLIGGPIILLNTGYDTSRLNIQSVVQVFANYPIYSTTVGSIGAGVVSPEFFVYLNFMTLSLGVFLVFIYFLTQRNKKFLLREYLILVILTVLNLSINEVFFPIQMFLMGVFFINDYLKKPYIKILMHSLALAITFLILFFIIQNSARDSLLTPSPDAPRFQIIMPQFKFNNLSSFIAPIHKESILTYNQNGFVWYLVDIRLLILLGFLLCFYIKDSLPLTFTVASFVSLFCSVFIKSTFSPWDTLRFFTLSYEMILFAFGFLTISLLKIKKTKLISLVIVCLLIPQISASYLNILKIIATKKNDSFSITQYTNPDLIKISQMIPHNARILIVSFLQDGNLDLMLTADAIVKHGLFVPFGPANTKMLNIAGGSEWYDAVLYLDPEAFKKLGVSHLYIPDSSLSFLPQERIKNIGDPAFFQKIAKTPNGTIYKVDDRYKNLPNNTYPTYKKMMDLIPDNKVVFLDTIYSDIRRLMFLNLALKDEKLYGRSYMKFLGIEYYTTIEINPPQPTENTINVTNIDYAIMRPGLYPSAMITGKYKKIMDGYLVSLWERVDLQ